ncbi:MAG: Rieske (2Fe-2S) protein [Chloroflexi bacterium]|nr:Rieske (2Fe-2S) protein [Chloroflexota bacterium]
MEHAVCRVDELAPGERRVVTIGRRDVLIVRAADGSFRALRDVCPHQGARLSAGYLGGVVVAERVGEYRVERDDEIVRCPWHNFEFDSATGVCLVQPDRYRVKTYPVSVRDDAVVVDVRD